MYVEKVFFSVGGGWGWLLRAQNSYNCCIYCVVCMFVCVLGVYDIREHQIFYVKKYII